MGCEAIGKLPTGMQEKPDDKWTVGLCHYHHRTGIAAQHKMGESDFWKMVGINPFAVAASLWIESGGAARAAEHALKPRPVKPRKTKSRNRNAPKRQIPGRPLQSRSAFPPGRKLQSRNTFQRATKLERHP
jgi:hypothetical protein